MHEQEDTEERATRDEAEGTERRIALAQVVLTSTLALLTALAVVVYAHETGRCDGAVCEQPEEEEILGAPAFPPYPLTFGRGYQPNLTDALQGVHRVDDRTVRISGFTVEYLLSREADLGRGTHLVPRFVRGRADGIKLFGVREGGVLHAMGFENGDVVTRVGTYTLTSPDALMEAYVALQRADAFTVEIDRRGDAFTMVVEIAGH